MVNTEKQLRLGSMWLNEGIGKPKQEISRLLMARISDAISSDTDSLPTGTVSPLRDRCPSDDEGLRKERQKARRISRRAERYS
eukprot:1818414-Pyramimonas_sp.AAC.1